MGPLGALGREEEGGEKGMDIRGKEMKSLFQLASSPSIKKLQRIHIADTFAPLCDHVCAKQLD